MKSSLPVVLLLAGTACEGEAETVYEYAPLDGPAFTEGPGPIAYPDRPVGLVTNSLSDTVSVVDVTSGEVIAQRSVGRNPVDIDGPHHVVVDAAGRYAYIALSYPVTTAAGPHAIHGSSVQPGYVQKLDLTDLSVVGQVRVDASPGEIVVTPDGKRVITSHFDLLRATQNPGDIEAARAAIAVVETDGMQLVGSTPAQTVPVCVAPHGMALSPDAARLYIACYGEDRIAVVDLTDLESTPTLIDVGAGVSGFGSPIYGPYAMRFVDDTMIAVSNTASKDVRFFDTRTQTFDPERTVLTLGAPYFPTVLADGRIAIPTQQPDALYVVDPTGAEETEIHNFDDACVLPHVVERIGDALAVVCEGDKKAPGSLVRLDEAFEVVQTVPLGVYPDALFAFGGGR